jgi:hypothetical protein
MRENVLIRIKQDISIEHQNTRDVMQIAHIAELH